MSYAPTLVAPPQKTIANVLVVEDDVGIAELEKLRLEEAGYHVIVTTNADDAFRTVGQGRIDLVLLDYRLPGGTDGLDFYARVKSMGYDLPVILVTGYSNETTVIRALRFGVRDFVTKSMEYLDYLPEAVERVLRQVSMERRLAVSEARLAGIIESAKDAVIVTEDDRTISLFNPAAEEMFGCRAEAAIGRPLSEFIPTIDSGDVPSRFGVSPHGLRANGKSFPIEATVSKGQTLGQTFFTVVVRDITARRLNEDALRLRDRAISAVELGIVITDARQPDHPIVYASPGFERMTGYSSQEAIGRNCRFLQGKDTDPSSVRRIREALERGETCHVEILNYRKDGVPFWNELSLSPIRNDLTQLVHYVAVQTDVTERRQLEERYRQSQKMEAVGLLAGGVAHDFNNLLTIINGYCQLLIEETAQDHPSMRMLEEIQKAGERSTGLTRQLLAFSRQQVLSPKVINLNEVVVDTAAMLRRLIGEDIRLVAVPTPGLWTIRADAGQVEQILLNLAVNARDAMPEGGRLEIEMQNVTLETDYTRLYPDVAPGQYVLLAVTDTGEGMTSEVKERIFEPFFTTKGIGKGTGLGLATVFGIIKQSGGHVAVESQVGVGSAFQVYFPRAIGKVNSISDDSMAPNRLDGNETVLLVEDEDGVRILSRHVLTAHGYRVIEATNGDEALDIAAQESGPIHLLVTDVVMPGSGGRVVAQKITERYPQIRILFLSGYPDDAIVRHGIVHESMNFLQKPFTPLSLAAKVRDVLDRPSVQK